MKQNAGDKQRCYFMPLRFVQVHVYDSQNLCYKMKYMVRIFLRYFDSGFNL